MARSRAKRTLEREVAEGPLPVDRLAWHRAHPGSRRRYVEIRDGIAAVVRCEGRSVVIATVIVRALERNPQMARALARAGLA